MTHFMVDLETLGTKPDSVVASIGIVAFDLVDSDSPPDANLGTLHLVLTDDMDDQLRVGRVIYPDSVKFWMQQSALSRSIFYPNGPAPQESQGERVRTVTALGIVEDFINDHCSDGSQPCVWGNGAAFDNVILRSLYESYGIEPPWSYGKDYCYRTLKNLGIGPRTAKHYGIAHNALDDAISQTVHLKEIMACIIQKK